MKKASEFKYSDRRDFAVIRQIARGNSRAFRHLYEKYCKHVYYSVLRKVGNVEAAEDIASVSLARAYEKLHLYRIDKTFNAWLAAIVRNEIVNYFRKKGRTVDTHSLDVRLGFDDSDDGARNAAGTTYEVSGDELNGEEAMILKERRQAVRRAIEQLSSISGQVVRLIAFEEKSYDETAEETGLDINAVKVRFFRAKKKLKEILAMQYEDRVL